MGYALVIGPCAVCRQIFGCNPLRVPSVRVRGVREPICKACIDRFNPERIKRGLEPIIPHPDAYEAVDENEL